MLTQLEIVNACLTAIGNTTVPDLEFPDVDTETATTKIKEALLDVLSRGWWFNMEPSWKQKPNSYNGKIEAPKSFLSFRTTGYEVAPEQLTVRGGFLYDLINHTQDMRPLVDHEGYVKLDIVQKLELPDLPYNAQRLVRETAVLKMLRAYDYAADKLRAQESEVQMATVMLERDHVRITKENSGTSRMVAEFTNAVGGANSFLGTPPRNPLGGSDR